MSFFSIQILHRLPFWRNLLSFVLDSLLLSFNLSSIFFQGLIASHIRISSNISSWWSFIWPIFCFEHLSISNMLFEIHIFRCFFVWNRIIGAQWFETINTGFRMDSQVCFSHPYHTSTLLTEHILVSIIWMSDHINIVMVQYIHHFDAAVHL